MTALLPMATLDESARSEDGAVDRLPAFDRYVERFRSVFGREDQHRYFAIYLRGLLHDGGHRRNVESIAAAVQEDADRPGTHLAQALNHFVTASPWDADAVAAVYRDIVRADAGPGDLVVHDGVFPKTGRHSVGVQRQFARALGRKLNCQMAVVVGHVGPAGYFPLAARLYLPAPWLRDHADGAAKAIPREHRTSVVKAEIAAGLIDTLLAEGWPSVTVAAEDAYRGNARFRAALAARQLADASTTDPLGRAARHFGWLKEHLGLGHFEGRSWVGWHHHVALVLAAYGYLVKSGPSHDAPPFPERATADWSI